MAKKEVKVEDVDLGCVLYTDGGCRPGYASDPNSAYGGWGIHGYTYPIGKHPNKLRTKKDVQTTIGYQVGETVTLEQQVVPNGYIDGYGSLTHQDTNNTAELVGFKNALELIKENGYKQAYLLLDSQYVLKGVSEGFNKWEATGWKKPDGSTYQNQTLWTELMSTYRGLQGDDVKIGLNWVNGHSGNLGNDRADYLATKGVYKGRNGVTGFKDIIISPVAKYRDPKPNINRLIAKHRYYFNTNYDAPLQSKDGRYVLHCGAHGSDDTLVGKPISDSVACVLYLKDYDPVLEAIRLKHRELIEDPYYNLCLMRLDTVLLPKVYDEIEKDGIEVLSIAPRRLKYEGLCTIDERQVTKIIRPSGLTFKLVEVHNFMESLYERYLEGKMTVTDITDHFYQKSTQTVKKKEVEVNTLILKPQDKAIEVEAKVKIGEKSFKYPTTISTGLDYPSREVMSAIAEHNPKVTLITWNISDNAFSYATILDVGEDSVIWMSKDSNLQLVYPERVIK